MAGPNGEACGGCRFWVRRPPPDEGQGECRRHAPAPVLLCPAPGPADSFALLGAVTVPDYWCGEFAAVGVPPPTVPPRPAGPEVLAADLRWSVRARRTLNRLGARTLGDVASLTAFDLLEMRGCGQTTLREIRDRLAHYGLVLAGESPPGSVAPWGGSGRAAAPTLLEPAPAPVAQSGA